MINKTIAFSNSGSFWKTRYSFISSCFAFLDKLFFSSPTKANNGEICWEHNKNNAPKNTFYGGIPISSSISVTFNQNPSSNKVYKSFSLEGTSNISGLNSIIVNNSSDDTQRKNATISLLDERGGILYGNVGQIQKVTGTNIKPIGIVSFIRDFPNGYTPTVEGNRLIGIEISSFISANNIPTSSDAKLFLSRSDESNTIADAFYKVGNAYTPALANTVVEEDVQGVLVQVNGAQDLLLNNSDFSEDVSFDNYLTLGDLHEDFSRDIGGNNYIMVEFNENNSNHAPSFVSPDDSAVDFLLHNPVPVYDSSQEGSAEQQQSFASNLQFFEDNTYILYAITPASAGGDDPKGQYADAVVTLGNENFELYALNLEYEGTQYDHSLQLRKRAQQTQGQSTRRKK